MNTLVFSYFDRVAGLFSQPILSVNRAVAIRNFVAVMRSGDNSVAAPDMELYEIGSFDSTTGLFTAKCPEFVARYRDYVE